MDPTKRELRQQKRAVKQAGNQHRRRLLRRGLAANPEEAHLAEEDLGRFRSATMNGMDRDSKRLDRERKSES